MEANFEWSGWIAARGWRVCADAVVTFEWDESTDVDDFGHRHLSVEGLRVSKVEIEGLHDDCVEVEPAALPAFALEAVTDAVRAAVRPQLCAEAERAIERRQAEALDARAEDF